MPGCSGRARRRAVGARTACDVTRTDLFVALGTSSDIFERGSAVGMHEDRGRRLRVPPVPPVHDGDERGREVGSLGREPVLVPKGPLLIRDLLEHAVVDKALQPVTENVLGDTEVVLELTEPAHASEHVAENQEGPAIADDLQGGGNGARWRVVRGRGLVRHGEQPSGEGFDSQPTGRSHRRTTKLAGSTVAERYIHPVTERLITTAEGSRAGAFAAADWGLIAVAGLTWGASFFFIAEGLEAFEPGLVTFLRIFFGLLTLTLVPRQRIPIPTRDRGRIVLLSVTWMAFPLTLFPIAQSRISSSLAGMINGSTPVAVAVVATVLLGRLPGRWQRAGLVAGLAGLVLISLPSIGEGGNSLVGALLVITAVASYGIAINMAAPLQQRYGSINVLWHVLAVSTILTLPFGAWSVSGSSLELSPLLAVIALGAGGTGLAFVAMATVVGRAGSTRGSVTVYLTPPIAIALGVWFRNESVEVITLVGCALTLLGAWLAGRPDDRRPTAVAPSDA